MVTLDDLLFLSFHHFDGKKTEIVCLDNCACPTLDFHLSGCWWDGDDAVFEEGTVLAPGSGKMVLWKNSNERDDHADG